jgi:hypothetical protein
MIGEILAGVSTIASLFGSLKSAQANKAMDQQLQDRQSELKTWYDKEYNTNYLDTSAARGTLAVLRNNKKETMQKVNQGNIIGGASDEKAVATADAVQKDYANNVAQLATQGTARQDRIEGEYMGQKSHLDDINAGVLQNKSQNWSNFSNNAMNAGIGMAEATGAGAFDKADAKLKGFFQGLRTKSPGWNMPQLQNDK